MREKERERKKETKKQRRADRGVNVIFVNALHWSHLNPEIEEKKKSDRPKEEREIVSDMSFVAGHSLFSFFFSLSLFLLVLPLSSRAFGFWRSRPPMSHGQPGKGGTSDGRKRPDQEDHSDHDNDLFRYSFGFPFDASDMSKTQKGAGAGAGAHEIQPSVD